MTLLPRALLLVPVALAGLAMTSVAVRSAPPAPTPRLAALSAVETGQWQLKPYSGEGGTRSLCISDVAALLQIRHADTNCAHYVVDDQPRTATVSYSCPGGGQGRTTIKMETSRLLDIQSQGIADNSPFEMRYEARRIGPCTTASAR